MMMLVTTWNARLAARSRTALTLCVVVGLSGCTQAPAPVVEGFSAARNLLASNYQQNGSFTDRVSGGGGQAPVQTLAAVPTPSLQDGSLPVRTTDSRVEGPDTAQVEELPGSRSRLMPKTTVAAKPLAVHHAKMGQTEEVVAAALDGQPVREPVVAAHPHATAAKVPASQPQTYVVQAGDTVYAIARKFKLPVGKLMAENGFNADSGVEVGQTIRLPGTAPTAVSVADVSPAAGEMPTAKVVSADMQTAGAAPGFVMHRVTSGETLFKISNQYGASVIDIMSANEFQTPQDLQLGMMVKVPTGAAAPASPQVATASAPTPVATPAQEVTVEAPVKSAPVVAQVDGSKFRGRVDAAAARVHGLAWPVNGKLLRRFGEQGDGVAHTGINIAVPENSTVLAAEGGQVIYAGDGLKTYGQLVLLRHAGGMVTAYAHNNQLLVKKGEAVKKGQVIALSGATGNVDQPQLHFEIRRAARAVDPLNMLAAR